jgi:hypothetical protein
LSKIEYFDPATLNYYTYALNNPGLLIDADGQEARIALAVLVGGLLIIPGIGTIALGLAVVAITLSAGAAMTMTRSAEDIAREMEAIRRGVREVWTHVTPHDLELIRAGREGHILEAKGTIGRIERLVRRIDNLLKDKNLPAADRARLEKLKQELLAQLRLLKKALQDAGRWPP